MRRVAAHVLAAAGGAVMAIAGGAGVAPAALARQPQVLRVGSYHGIAGQFTKIQAAVDAAKPYDLILVAPGDYKTTSSRAPKTTDGNFPAAVLIKTADITLRGMSRNRVVIDGTRSGPPCTDRPSEQNFGPKLEGAFAGLNGVMVWKADDVSVENLTACNFLSGPEGFSGNQIWWNGGADSATIGGWGYYGSYLNATSTYYNSALAPAAAESTAAAYGIFSSDWDGGTWDHTYASNMNDSGYYIGACQDQCNQTVDEAWAEFNALGYSGSNSGGNLVIEHSQFDNNEDGLDTNSQNTDLPPPQDGVCPNDGISPITHTRSCWVFMDNYVHDNNNPNVPAAGGTAAGPVGTGMSISGGRDDTIIGNRFTDNDAWGLVLVPYLDSGAPCTGGTMNEPTSGRCLFDDWGDAILGNTFADNGGYGHPTNGDIGWMDYESGHPTPCFSGNTDTTGTLTTSPSGLQFDYPRCTGEAAGANGNTELLLEEQCDLGRAQYGATASCPSGPYPQVTEISNGLHALPATKLLPTMPHPCSGVAPNPWCSGIVIKPGRCTPSHSILIPLSLAVGEQLTSVTVEVAGKHSTFQRQGSKLRVALGGARHQLVRVKITEALKVRQMNERFSFTELYRRC